MNARAARDALVAALAGGDVAMVAGPSAGLAPIGLRVSSDVALLRVDGVDPTSALAQALPAHRRRGG